MREDSPEFGRFAVLLSKGMLIAPFTA